MCLLYNNISDH
uniref:Uncharacterized protein n=1 Tax=Lepeophtheirus salmonis TaxID=72036 RepID=A0A0K2UAP8_LEPSM